MVQTGQIHESFNHLETQKHDRKTPREVIQEDTQLIFKKKLKQMISEEATEL